MSRCLLAVLLASLCGLSASTVTARGPSPGGLHAAAVAAPQSRMEGRDALDAAVAAAVIGAVSAQFSEPRVEVTLQDVEVLPASVQDRTVRGQGRLRLGNDGTWIPFGFEVLYDTATASVSYPRLVLGGSTGRDLAPGSRLADALRGQVQARLTEEFQQQPVRFEVSRVQSRAAGARYVHLRARGTVDFGAEGSAPADIDAIFDNREQRWVRVGYELAGGA